MISKALKLVEMELKKLKEILTHAAPN